MEKVEGLGYITLNWLHPEREGFLPYHYMPPEVSKDGKIQLKVFFPKYMVPGKLELSSIEVDFPESKNFKKKSYNYNIPRGTDHLHVQVQPSAPVADRTKIDANGIQLSNEKNEKGILVVKVRVPIKVNPSGLEESFKLGFWLRSPTKREYHLVDSGLKKGEGNWLETSIELPENAETGEYMLDVVSVSRVLKKGEGVDGASGSSTLWRNYDEEEIKILERQIKRTFNVSR